MCAYWSIDRVKTDLPIDISQSFFPPLILLWTSEIYESKRWQASFKSMLRSENQQWLPNLFPPELLPKHNYYFFFLTKINKSRICLFNLTCKLDNFGPRARMGNLYVLDAWRTWQVKVKLNQWLWEELHCPSEGPTPSNECVCCVRYTRASS